MTQTQIKTKVEFAVAEEYKWRDRSGKFHKIEDMHTRHLFHVVRMVWDHSMPKEWQTSFRNRYVFPQFYTTEYMALTVKLMVPALFLRRDVTPEMLYWLKFMESCLLDKRLQIPFVLRVGYDK